MIVSYNNKIVSYNNKWVDKSSDLPSDTIRLLYKPGVTPTFSKGTAVQVSQNPNIWDLTYYSFALGWTSLLQGHEDLIEVLGANSSRIRSTFRMFSDCSRLISVQLFDTSTVTNMSMMFAGCSSLTTVPLFNTSNVTSMGGMFQNCTSLTSVPLFNTSSVTDMAIMFYNCSSLTSVPLFDTTNVTDMSLMLSYCSSLTSVPLFNTSNVNSMDRTFYACRNVQSGALALYQQASTQATPPSNHEATFYDCGRNTVTGAAEMAQIPTSWGGDLE